MTQESTTQFPFETTTKDGRKATVLGAMPDGRLIGYIEFREVFPILRWEADGSFRHPGSSITLPLQVKPLTTYRMRGGGLVWTTGLIRSGWIHGMESDGILQRWRVADGRWSAVKEAARDLIEELPPGTTA